MNESNSHGSYAALDAVMGGLFGICFLIFATIVHVAYRGLPINLASLLECLSDQPLQWIADTTPLLLGLLGFAAGRRQDEAKASALALKKRIAEEFALIAENVPGLLGHVDSDYRYLFASKEYANWRGLNADQIVGKRMLDVLGEQCWNDSKEYFAKTLRAERLTFERVVRAPGEEDRVQSVSLIPELGENGRVVAFFELIQDITEHQEIEETIRRQTRSLAALHDTALDLVSHLRVDDLLQTIIERAAALVGTQHGFIYLLKPGESEMEMHLGIGSYAELRGTRTAPGAGLAGTVWQTGVPLVVDDYPIWPGRLGDQHRSGVQTMVGVPLRSRDQIVGVIGLAHLELGRRFGPAELDALNRFATMASLALDNATLFQQSQNELVWQAALYRASEMIGKATTIESVLRGAAELVPLLDLSACTVDVITEYDQEGTPVRLNLYTVTYEDGEFTFLPNAIGKAITGWLPTDPAYYSELRATVFPDLLNPSMAVPQDNLKSAPAVEFMLRLGLRGAAMFGLGTHGRRIGYLTFGSTSTLTRPPEEYIERLRNIVDLVATAVDNLQLAQQTQKELAERRRAERFLDSVVENLPITLFAKDAQERRYVRWNRAGEELLGLPRGQILGRNDCDFFGAGDQEVLAEKRLVDIPEDLIQTRGNGLRVMHTRKLPILDEAGKPQYLLGIAEDITERKRVEEALVKRTEELEQAYQKLREDQEGLLIAEKMASLGRLTAGLAHEMNTPLAAVRAALVELNRLVKEYESSIGDPEVSPDDHRKIVQEMQRCLRLADSGTERTAVFVRGVRTQTRDLAPHERHTFNSVPVIREALLLLGHALRKSGCTLTFEPAVEYVELNGSPGRLAQIITNLVTNAIDASVPKGGGPIDVQLTPSGFNVTLKVTDQGTGIAPEILPRIFDPMFTTKPFGQGSGLGLTIVRDIVTGDFGGTIEVQTEAGQGTSFRLQFPNSIETA